MNTATLPGPPRPILDKTLRREFLDEDHWRSLARRCRLNMPMWGLPATPASMRRYLRKLRIKEAEYLDATGYTKIEDFNRLNPDWPLRAWVGLLLEYFCEKEDAKRTISAYERD